MDWMLSVMDNEIQKQRRLIEELRRPGAESRDKELRVKTQTYWKLKVKDNEIQEQSRLIGELRCQGGRRRSSSPPPRPSWSPSPRTPSPRVPLRSN